MILWFSGTGNSRYVAEMLASELGQSLRRLTPDLRNGSLTPAPHDDTVIWVCPVYSWGLPPYVRAIIKNVDLGSAPLIHHLVLTCGDDCGLTAEMWRSDLAKRGWQSGLAFSVTMPNNYVCMSGFDVDTAELAQHKLSAASLRIREIARSIADFRAGSGDCPNELADVVRGRFAWIKTRIIYPWFVRHAMSPKPFRYTRECISCGKCAAICPLRNITMSEPSGKSTDSSERRRKRPVWGTDCAFCLACYHVCPRHAVMYGDKTGTKGQYMNPQS